jgi:hypothetical protein
MADIHGSPAGGAQNPQAPDSGSAPVPFGGAMPSEPPVYAVDLGADAGGATSAVMAPVTGLGTAESAAAHDIAAGLADAPYSAGPLAPVDAAGDPDAGGRDDVAPDVAGSVAAAEARWREHQSDLRAGGTIGDLMMFPPSPLDPGAGVGNTTPAGGFYDPPRDYGAPGFQGDAQ